VAPPPPSWDEAAIEAETADSPTGLRGRTKAKERLASVLGNGMPFYAVVFVLEGYASLEERFGADAAQDCLIAASNYLLQSLGSEDQLYHWDRYAFIGILTRETRPVDVTLDMMKSCGARPQQSIRVGQRTILASMPIKPNAVAIQEFQELGDLVQHIDQFARQGA
jgi:GGDEF domain-containing protein